jgi:hypothetical protein
MPQLTESQINALYASIGWEDLRPLAGDANDVLGIYTGDSAPVVGAQVAWNGTGTTGVRASNTNRANFTGTNNTSFINLRSLNGIMSRVNTGGGLSFGFLAKMPTTSSLWRFGQNIDASNAFHFGSVFNTTRLDTVWTIAGTAGGAQSLGYVFSSTANAGFNDNQWHHFGVSICNKTGYQKWYVDGYLHAFAINANIKASSKFALTAFHIGSVFNISAVQNFTPMALAGFASAARTFTDDEWYLTSRLELVKYMPAMRKSYHLGVNSPTISADLTQRIATGSATIVHLGDSTSSDSGPIFQRDMPRQISKISGGRLANLSCRVSGDGAANDANTFPGAFLQIAAGATTRIPYQLSQQMSEQDRNVLAGDVTNREPDVLDVDAGIEFELYIRRQTGLTSGNVTWAVRAGAFQISTGSEAFSANLGTVVVPFGDITGPVSQTTKSVMPAVPDAGHFEYFLLEITNNTSATITVQLHNLVSVNNRSGVYYHLFARGGHRIGSGAGFGDHLGAVNLLRAIGATHVVLDLGTNDSTAVEPETIATSLDALHTAYTAALPDLKMILILPAQRANQWESGAGASGHTPNIRLEQYAQAIEDYCAANPSKQIKIVNGTRLWHDQGINELGISLQNKNVIGAWAAGTAYALNSVAWIDNAYPGYNRSYFWSRLAGNTGNDPLRSALWAPTLYTTTDGIHHTTIGQNQRSERVASMLIAGAAPAGGITAAEIVSAINADVTQQALQTNAGRLTSDRATKIDNSAQTNTPMSLAAGTIGSSTFDSNIWNSSVGGLKVVVVGVGSTIVEEPWLDASATRTALGLAQANLDTQLSDIESGGGLTGEEAATLSAIKISTDKITTTSVRANVYPAPTISLRVGDAYTAASGQVRDISKADGDQWPTNLTGWTVTLRAAKSENNVNAGTATLQTTLSIIQATGAQTVRIDDLDAADTAGLAPGEWTYWVTATNAALVNTLRSGVLIVAEAAPVTA